MVYCALTECAYCTPDERKCCGAILAVTTSINDFDETTESVREAWFDTSYTVGDGHVVDEVPVV